MPEIERDEGKLQQHKVELVLRPGDRSYAVDVAEEEGVAEGQNALGAGAERQAVGRDFLQVGEAHEVESVTEREVEDSGKQRLAFVHRMEFDFGRQGDAVIVEGLRSSFEDVELRALRIEREKVRRQTERRFAGLHEAVERTDVDVTNLGDAVVIAVDNVIDGILQHDAVHLAVEVQFTIILGIIRVRFQVRAGVGVFRDEYLSRLIALPKAIGKDMEIVVRVLSDHLACAGFVRFVKNVNDMLGEIGGAIELHAETTTTDVMGDDPVFQLGHFPSSSNVGGRPTASEIIERLSLSSPPSNCNLRRARLRRFIWDISSVKRTTGERERSLEGISNA